MLAEADILALSLLSKITAAEVIALSSSAESLEDALSIIGRHEMDLRDVVQRQQQRCTERGVRIIPFCHPLYPARLRAITRRPAVLYVLGEMPAEVIPMIGVVGTRSCSVQYGKPVTDLFVGAWGRMGCGIVSGLANGIDMIAHEASLRSGASTIAVIASGIDRITPIPAQRMAERIASRSGCVVSEYPCGVAALPPYFPARNRIISGMSDAVVVVESKQTGGALITAEFAIEQGRPLYAVPGPVTSDRSAGCNNLIAEKKAQLLRWPEEVVRGSESHAACAEPGAVAPSRVVTAEEAATLWKCSLPEALSRLFTLEMNGLANAMPGGRYVVRE